MADYSTPVKNQEFKFDVVLYSQATGQVLANPTLASGDVKLWDTGAADWTTNITTLPSVSPSGSARVTVTVSASEMNNEEVAIKFSDAAGSEWHDLYIFISPQDAGAGGTVDANLIQVDGVALADATLTLKKLVVSNSAGNAVEFTSTGSNGNGLQITGHGSGYGTRIFAGATGVGLGVSGGATSGGGIVVTTTSGIGVNFTSDDNAGFYVGSLATHAVQFIGTGTGAGLRVEGGTSGNGITAVSGGTAGYGFSISGTDGDIDANITGNLSGSVGSVTTVSSGAISSSSFASGAINAAAIATDAIGADEVSAAAVTKIQTGLATSSNQTTIITHLTDIKGVGWSSGTDTLEQIRDRGDSAWTTATGFSTHSAADVISAMGTGTFLTAIPWNASWDAQVESEVNDGLVAIGLDHLISTSVVGADIADDSIIAKMVSKSATADWDSYSPSTDSLEALYDALAALAPLSNTADAFTQTTGTVISGTYTDTYTDNATRHVLAPNGGNVIDAYYDFNVGTGRAPISVAINGYWQGTGFAYVWVYDHVDEAWVDLSGTGNRMPSRTSDANYSMALSREHISDAGLVQIRFTTTSTTGTDRLRIDRLLVYSITDAGGNLLTPQMIWEYNNRDINSIAGSTTAATNLKNQALTVISGAVVSDGSNSATSFKTNLAGGDDFYGDSNGGGVLVFITGSNAGQAIRVSGFVDSTNFITVESAFSATPSADDEFIVLGRIEV